MNDRPTTQQFPKTIYVMVNLRLAASYRFDQVMMKDGATAKIPVQALPQVMKIFGHGAFLVGVRI